MTWSKFLTAGGSPIYFSYSDDQGRSWSAEKSISGAASFCVFSAANECRLQPGLGSHGEPDDWGSVRLVHQRQHAGRGPVPDGALDGRRRNFQGPFLVTTRLRPQLSAVGDDAAGLRAARSAGQPAGSHEQLLPAELLRQHHRGQAWRRVRRRPVRGDLGQPLRHRREHEHGHLPVQVDQRRHDLDRADASERRPLRGSAGPRLRPGRRLPADARPGHGAMRRRSQLRQRPVVPVGGHLGGRRRQRRLPRPAPRYRLDGLRVARQPATGRQLSRLVLGRRLPRRDTPTRAIAWLRRPATRAWRTRTVSTRRPRT